MIQANELRIGNKFIRELHTTRGLEYDHDFVLTEGWVGKLFGGSLSIALQDLSPIPLTPEVLLACGAVKSSIDNPFFSHYDFHFSLDRHISVAQPGTPNEMVMLLEKNRHGDAPSVVCIRNFDYVGKTYLHQLQNLYFCLTGEELPYKP